MGRSRGDQLWHLCLQPGAVIVSRGIFRDEDHGVSVEGAQLTERPKQSEEMCGRRNVQSSRKRCKADQRERQRKSGCMEVSMEELIELNRRRLRVQKLTALLLAVLLAVLLAGGMMARKELRQMSERVSSAMERLEQIDVERINETLSGTQEMMESVSEFTDAVDSVTQRVRDLDDWIGGMFGR